jgi:hypothetical protein
MNACNNPKKHYKRKLEMEENMVTLFTPQFMNIYNCDCCQSYLQLLPCHHHHHTLKHYRGNAKDGLVAVMNTELRFNTFCTFIVAGSKR